MSEIDKKKLINDNDDDDNEDEDEDFIPPSPTKSEQDDEENGIEDVAERNKDDDNDITEEEKLRREKKVDNIWESFKNSNSNNVNVNDKAIDEPNELITITKKISYAGKELENTLKVDKNSIEAKNYLQQQSSLPSANNTNVGDKDKREVKPPPKKKRKSKLDPGPSPIPPPKLTTLQKSNLDWKSYTQSDETLSNELDYNKKSGGYLSKFDFLERTRNN